MNMNQSLTKICTHVFHCKLNRKIPRKTLHWKNVVQMSSWRGEIGNYLEKVNFSSLRDRDQFNINTSHNSLFTFQGKKEKICLNLSKIRRLMFSFSARILPATVILKGPYPKINQYKNSFKCLILVYIDCLLVIFVSKTMYF